jgi:TolB-like protein/Flp pilus assembly protein TadD
LRRRKVARVAIAYLLVAWLLVQVAGETFEPLGLPMWSRTLVIVGLAIGFPIALVLAWAFDVTPRGIERTPAAAPPASAQGPARDSRHGMPPADPASLLPAAAVAATHASVAVLPFVDMSPDRDQDHFCDGIAEEIINSLCCVRGLKVAARTSAFQYKGRATDVREIGRALGVGAVLEGSVRKFGDRLRVTAQLVGAGDGYHLWSETFDRRLEDVFAIQDEIAQQVRSALKISLATGDSTGFGRGGTASSDAYEYYLRGRALLRRHGELRLDARQMFQRSIAFDPDFALAHAGLGAAIAERLTWQQTHDPAEIHDALRALERAEALRPGLVEAMVALGSLQSAQGRNDEASATFAAAIERAPSYPDTYYWYGRHAFSIGDHARAAQLFQRNVELEPTNYTAWGLLASARETVGDKAGRLEAALRCVQLIDRQLELYPDDVRAIQFGASANAAVQRRERALELCARALLIEPDAPGTLYNVACAYALLGENDKALDLLEKWVETGAGGNWIREDPDFRKLKASQRFGALLERLEQRQLAGRKHS